VALLEPAPADAGAAAWSKAPVAFSAATVPPEARIAAARAAATTVPAPALRFGAGPDFTGGGAGVSNQRSGVGSAVVQWVAPHEARGSGAGEYDVAAAGEEEAAARMRSGRSAGSRPGIARRIGHQVGFLVWQAWRTPVAMRPGHP
jgi:hypothetical protein